MATTSEYGSWKSPITADLIAQSAIRLSGLKLDQCKNQVYWIEGRASEGGRSAITGIDTMDSVKDMTPAEVNSRTRVHEYGGGSYYPVGDSGDLITCDFTSQRLCLVRGGESGTVHDLVKNEIPNQYRYADFCVGPSKRGGSRLLYAVREDHSIDEPASVVNAIVCFAVTTSDGSPILTTPEAHCILVNSSGDPNIMVSNPRVDPSGKFFSWVQWNHPNMPWDNTQLFVAKLSRDGQGFESEPICIAGGVGESVMEPMWWRPPIDRDLRKENSAGLDASLRGAGYNEDEISVLNRWDKCALVKELWASDNTFLFFLSDRSDGWWNIHRTRVNLDLSQSSVTVECVLRCDYEFGSSAWNFGNQHYDFLPDSDLITTWTDGDGTVCLIRLDPRQQYCIDKKNNIEAINSNTLLSGLIAAEIPLYEIRSISDICADKFGNVFIMGGGPSLPASVLKWKAIDSQCAPFSKTSGSAVGALKVIRKSIDLDIDPSYMSAPERIEFPTITNGIECTANGIFYAPTNPLYSDTQTSLPPLLVKLHGGPTGKASNVYRLDIQFFTSRGFAVLDVDYGGSSGYGRAYRERLRGNWGMVDVEDCCRGAAYLAEKRLVDPDRLAIQGGSAGGYTALASIAFRDVFHAATSSYGIGDLEALLHDTHKFESKYMDGLVGPYPESKPIYESRCPIRYVDNIKCPVLFLHGKEDPVCPPNQATDMFAQLTKKGVPSCLILFDGESHGWRKADTICFALNAELNFYGRIFKFKPDTEITLDIVGEGDIVSKRRRKR